jgi:hypothetical protein
LALLADSILVNNGTQGATRAVNARFTAPVRTTAAAPIIAIVEDDPDGEVRWLKTVHNKNIESSPSRRQLKRKLVSTIDHGGVIDCTGDD